MLRILGLATLLVCVPASAQEDNDFQHPCEGKRIHKLVIEGCAGLWCEPAAERQKLRWLTDMAVGQLVVEVLRCVAAERGADFDALASVTSANAARLFGLPALESAR